MKRLGFIGYGLRSETMMKAFRAIEADITVSAIVDPRQEEIAPLLKMILYSTVCDGMNQPMICLIRQSSMVFSSERAAPFILNLRVKY